MSDSSKFVHASSDFCAVHAGTIRTGARWTLWTGQHSVAVSHCPNKYSSEEPFAVVTAAFNSKTLVSNQS